jgi:hypothetical protein
MTESQKDVCFGCLLLIISDYLLIKIGIAKEEIYRLLYLKYGR